MTVIADTGFVVAVINTKEKNHRSCQQAYAREAKIYLPQPALTEIAYLLRRDVGTLYVANFLMNLPRSKYEVTSLTENDLLRTGQILRQYADSRVDFVDASIAAVAERLEIARVLTLDHRDFSIIRPRHIDYFELIPSG